MADFNPLSLIGNGISGAFGLAGGKAQADAMKSATDESIAFQRQQAENDWKNQQLAQQANYQLYASKQRANNSIRAALGLAPVDIPNYVGGVDPNFNGAPSLNVNRPGGFSATANPANYIKGPGA